MNGKGIQKSICLSSFNWIFYKLVFYELIIYLNNNLLLQLVVCPRMINASDILHMHQDNLQEERILSFYAK